MVGLKCKIPLWTPIAAASAYTAAAVSRTARNQFSPYLLNGLRTLHLTAAHLDLRSAAYLWMDFERARAETTSGISDGIDVSVNVRFTNSCNLTFMQTWLWFCALEVRQPPVRYQHVGPALNSLKPGMENRVRGLLRSMRRWYDCSAKERGAQIFDALRFRASGG